MRPRRKRLALWSLLALAGPAAVLLGIALGMPAGEWRAALAVGWLPGLVAVMRELYLAMVEAEIRQMARQRDRGGP